jgi:hypothetical protein
VGANPAYPKKIIRIAIDITGWTIRAGDGPAKPWPKLRRSAAERRRHAAWRGLSRGKVRLSPVSAGGISEGNRRVGVSTGVVAQVGRVPGPRRPEQALDEDATRYLSTAAHLDEGYGRGLIRHLLVREDR